ncbi:hypothetical protein [Halobaculum sp. EA56]|uniref:DUF7847 domain-containing protein n=1 Tax=Halobaculum sp. EA56 TaxID=3421648 RepID=UPI003EB739D4
MALQTALRRTPSALARNPVVFVPAFALSALQVPQLLLQSSAPLVAAGVSILGSLLSVVLAPFVQGGLFGMADEALDGRTSLSTFLREGRDNYVTLFVVYLLLIGLNLALGVLVFIGAVVGVFGVAAGDGGGPGAVLLAVAALVGGGVLLAYLLVVFLIQFYGQAVVLDGLGAVDSLRHSAGLVRRNLASVLGYTLVVGALSAAFGIAVALASAAGATPPAADPFAVGLPSPADAAVAALVLAGSTLFGGAFGVLSVAFYRELDA